MVHYGLYKYATKAYGNVFSLRIRFTQNFNTEKILKYLLKWKKLTMPDLNKIYYNKFRSY